MKKELPPLPVILACFFFAKLLVFGSSWPEGFAALVVLLGIHADHIIRHLYPSRVDLYLEVSSIREELYSLRAMAENIEHDVTGLKFGKVK